MLHSVSFWTEFSRPLAVSLAAVLLALSLIFLLLYISVFKILNNRPLFKNNFYWILKNIAILDCVFLFGTVMAAFMTLVKHSPFPLFFEIVSAIHAVYEWTLHVFCLVLALKIFIVVFNLEMKYTNNVLKFLVLVVWKSLVVNLHLNAAYGITLAFLYELINFGVLFSGPKASHVFTILAYIDRGFVILSLLLYLVVIGYLLLKKLQLIKNKTIEACDVFILYIGLATYIPGAVYMIVNSLVDSHVTKAALPLSVFMSLLLRLIPVCNFLGLLLVNHELRTIFLSNLQKKLKCGSRRRPEVQRNSHKWIEHAL